MANSISIDGFRFINHLHTTVRQLIICNQIVLHIGDKQLPKDLLKRLLIDWSFEEERNNPSYLASKGKLTDIKANKPSSAFPQYLEFCVELGLITQFNGIYSNTRLSFILLHFLKSKDGNSPAINCFYLFILLQNDADGLLLLIEILNKRELSQSEIQRAFKDAFLNRLVSKERVASSILKEVIRSKYSAVYKWQKPEKYAEHLVAPRCEWMMYLGILEISKSKNTTSYKLSDIGKKWLEMLPVGMNDLNILDINSDWLYSSFFKSITVFTSLNSNRLFSTLTDSEKHDLVIEALITSSSVVKSSIGLRIPLFDGLLYSCLYCMSAKSVAIDFFDIVSLVKDGLSNNEFSFSLFEKGRINESYITIIKVK